MNIVKLRSDLTRDEGVVHKVYLDHLGLPTFGIGHLITPEDPEYGLEVGTPVSEERVVEAFNEDIEDTIKDTKALYPNFDFLPETIQHVLLNMLFNMGMSRLRKFRRMNEAVSTFNWYNMWIEMKDSRWYRQVTNRAERMRNDVRGCFTSTWEDMAKELEESG